VAASSGEEGDPSSEVGVGEGAWAAVLETQLSYFSPLPLGVTGVAASSVVAEAQEVWVAGQRNSSGEL
jgi:hypothetical protein